MGYSQAQKVETHQRIVEVAAKRFLELGLDGIGVADVMKEAGVTVGGFYKHFPSREDLVLQAIEHSVVQIEERLVGSRTLLEFVSFYLSDFHRDNPGLGCALGAIAEDTARSSDAVRSLYASRVEHTLAYIETLIPTLSQGEKRARALLILGSCIGAVSMARAVPDPILSRQILESTQQQIMKLLSPPDDQPMSS